VQAVAEHRVGHDGKKPKGGVCDPFDLHASTLAGDPDAIEGRIDFIHFDAESRSRERGAVGDGVFDDESPGIVKNVYVFREPRRFRTAVQRSGPRYVAVGVSPAAYRGKYSAL